MRVTSSVVSVGGGGHGSGANKGGLLAVIVIRTGSRRKELFAVVGHREAVRALTMSLLITKPVPKRRASFCRYVAMLVKKN